MGAVGHSSARTPRLGANARKAIQISRQVKLGPSYGKIFFLIAGFIDGGVSDPSWSELAERSKLERSTVRNAIKELGRRGVLGVRSPGEGLRDEYELRIPKKAPKGRGRK